MHHAVSTASRILVVLSLVGLARAADPVIEVVQFGDSLATTQGGLFRCFGAQPNHLQDQLTTLGNPPSGAWRLAAVGDAPATGFGGFVPLFDTTLRGEKPRLLDISAAPILEARLLGDLAGRKVLVELCTDPSGEGTGVSLGAVEAGQLKKDAWTALHWSAPTEGVDLKQIAAVRFTFDGAGPGWFAIADLRFVKDAAQAPAAPTPPAAPPATRQALWVWTPKEILADPAQVDRLLAFCKDQHLTDLFWQIPHTKPADGPVEHILVEEQRAFNVRAAQAGLAMHALDGDPHWVLKENHQKVFDVVAAVERFNQAGPPEARYVAVHMDNEPYVLKNWKESPAEQQRVINDYYALNQALQKQVHAAGMKYGVDIPFWWDQFHKDGKPVFAVKTDVGEVSLLEALFPLLDNAGIMSYRVRALGNNGVVDCCRTEFALGAKVGVEVFASVELGVGEKVEAGITFGVYPIDYFLTQRDTLLRVLPHQKGCAGLAIHYYDPFVDMMEKRR